MGRILKQALRRQPLPHAEQFLPRVATWPSSHSRCHAAVARATSGAARFRSVRQRIRATVSASTVEIM
ncbi:hypothetical protein ACQPXT_02415 [Streptomyces sp. CA-100214]